LNGSHSDSELRGDLGLRQRGEKPKLHETRQPRRRLRQPRASVIDRDEHFRFVVSGHGMLVERDLVQSTATTPGGARSRAIHEYVSHRDRRHRAEVRLVPPRAGGAGRQLQIRLVHQRGRVQRLIDVVAARPR